MSYEHCNTHDLDATNGCPKCAADPRRKIKRQDGIVHKWGPDVDGVSGAEVRVTDWNHDDLVSVVLTADLDALEALAAPRGDNRGSHLSGLPCITNMVAAHVVEIPADDESEEGEIRIDIDIDNGFKPDDFVAVVYDHELRALGQLALTAQEAEKQRAGAVRHLEATRAELVKVTAERDAALELVKKTKADLARANKLQLDVVDRIHAAAAADAEDAAAHKAAVIQAAGGKPTIKMHASIEGTPETVTVSSVAEVTQVMQQHFGPPDRPRRRLPAERQGVTHAFAIHTPEGRHKGYITVGLYDDGSVGEVFLKLDQQGSQVSGFCDAWSIAVSMLLQTGTSLETVCRKFRGARFEPSGRTETPGIRVALSPVDYAARYLERRFVSKLPLTDDAGPPAEGEV